MLHKNNFLKKIEWWKTDHCWKNDGWYSAKESMPCSTHNTNDCKGYRQCHEVVTDWTYSTDHRSSWLTNNHYIRSLRREEKEKGRTITLLAKFDIYSINGPSLYLKIILCNWSLLLTQNVYFHIIHWFDSFVFKFYMSKFNSCRLAG